MNRNDTHGDRGRAWRRDKHQGFYRASWRRSSWGGVVLGFLGGLLPGFGAQAETKTCVHISGASALLSGRLVLPTCCRKGPGWSKSCCDAKQSNTRAVLPTGRLRYWKQVVAAIRGAMWHLSPRDVKRVRRTLRWKYRRLARTMKRRKARIPRWFSSRIKGLHRQLATLRRRRLQLPRKRWSGYRQRVAAIARRARRARRSRRVTCGTRWGGGRLRLQWPTQSRRVFSRFGRRIGPFGRRKSFHSGIDIASGHGALIRAAAPGVVVGAGWHGSCGLALMIRHRSGAILGYCHLSRFDVWRGMKVCTGQLIGRMGTTGSSTGSHLHFTLRKRGRYVDPMPYLRGTRRQAN